MTQAAIIQRVRKMEEELQKLKAELYFRLPKKGKNLLSLYKEEDIFKEVKKIRRKLWNEKYSKAV